MRITLLPAARLNGMPVIWLNVFQDAVAGNTSCRTRTPLTYSPRLRLLP
jgi:hypothetical protein